MGPGFPRLSLLGVPPIHILEPDDIVFAKISSGLHLYKKGGRSAWVSEPMLFANRNISRLVLTQQLDVIALGDFEGTLDYDPMLSPVLMTL